MDLASSNGTTTTIIDTTIKGMITPNAWAVATPSHTMMPNVIQNTPGMILRKREQNDNSTNNFDDCDLKEPLK